MLSCSCQSPCQAESAISSPSIISFGAASIQQVSARRGFVEMLCAFRQIFHERIVGNDQGRGLIG